MGKPKLKVLIVEDEPDILEVLRFAFHRAGYEVLKAESGEKGISRAIVRDPDLIVLDLDLSSMLSGLEVYTKLQSNMLTSHAPILTLVSESRDGDSLFGIRDFIQKPFQIRDVLAMASDLLARARARAAAEKSESKPTAKTKRSRKSRRQT